MILVGQNFVAIGLEILTPQIHVRDSAVNFDVTTMFVFGVPSIRLQPNPLNGILRQDVFPEKEMPFGCHDDYI